MNKKIRIAVVTGMIAVFTMVILLVSQPKEKLPEPEYPLNEDTITEAMGAYGYPASLYIEVNEYTDYSEMESRSYTVRDKDKSLFAGFCFGILTHKTGEHRGLGISFSTIDREEDFSEEELQKAVRLATFLFGGFTDDMQVYDMCTDDGAFSGNFFWEGTVENIDCQVIYTPENVRKLMVHFATDIDLFVHPEKP